MELTHELVKGLFDYHEDGYLVWKVKRRPNIKQGDRAGCLQHNTSGSRYRVVVNGKHYLSSRLIFLWHKGYLPIVVDHENHNKLDDRINNLRAANYSKNGMNSTSANGSTSIYLGVHFEKDSAKWRAKIRVGNKDKHLGRFITQELAAVAYNKGAVLYFKEFANLNIIKP